MERRNVFQLFSAWLNSSPAAGAQAKALIASVDASGDGQLGMAELKQLLIKARGGVCVCVCLARLHGSLCV